MVPVSGIVNHVILVMTGQFLNVLDKWFLEMWNGLENSVKLFVQAWMW